jgi:hypothetical protein
MEVWRAWGGVDLCRRYVLVVSARPSRSGPTEQISSARFNHRPIIAQAGDIKRWERMTFREFCREFATGCLGHFIISLAAAALLGTAAHYLGLSRWAIFVLVVVVIFSASVLIPGRKTQ